jgi:RHS repeat-associated protein
MSANFPTTPGAFNSSGVGTDIFVSKLSPDGEGLEFSAIIGGNSYDVGSGIAIDDTQNIYITGSTWSNDLPVTSGAYDRANSGGNAFVIKLNPTGTNLEYATYFGTNDVQGFDIAVNNNGEAYVVGQVLSSTFPTTTGAYDTDSSGWDGFVTRFNADGSDLIFSTYLGGTGNDCEVGGVAQECSIALDSNGAVYIIGHTLSNDFPTTAGAYDQSYNGGYDMFVSKLLPDGSDLIYSTFVGGSGNDWCDPECAIDLDKDGYAYIVGTTSGNFPTSTSAYNRTYNGGSSDVVIAKLEKNGGNLVYSTYLGTSGSDIGHAITVENGFATITGETTSADFPHTPNAFQESFGGGTQDAFVTFLDSNGSRLIYSTFLGGSGNEWGKGISSSSSGNIIAIGVTGSNNFPTTTSSTLGSSYVTNFNAANSIVYNPSVISNCSGDCQLSGTQGLVLGPINTRTGGLFYQTDDISLPTSATELNFFRTYSSLATDLYSSTLGYGWTHNLDTRLIFPTDPGGETGYVLFKAHTANQYQFVDNGDGTYTPAPGIVGSLVFNNGQYVLTYPNQTVYTFNSTGRLVSWADAEGHIWQYTYVGGLVEQVSADGGTRYLRLGYDGQGRIVSVTDHTERAITYTYDGNGDLVSATSLGGGAWQYEYDSAHRLTRVVDPMGNTDERTEYDAQGRAIKQWDGLGNLTGELTYNTDGTTTITYASGNVETHTYNGRNILSGEENSTGEVTEKTYDNNFRPTTITDAGGSTTHLTWDTKGANLLEVKDALGNQTSITYDALNNPKTVVGPAPYNYQTTYEYSGALLTSVMDAAHGETTYTYTPEGYLESVTDGEGVTTTYGYDSHGQRTSMTDELQNTWHYAYDDLGRLIDTTDPLERVTHNVYDAAGRMISVTRNYDLNRIKNADNEWNIVTEYEYDAAGNQILVRDTLNRETRYEYDNAGRLIKTIDPELHETKSEYDEAGRLKVTIDALQHHTYYFYDEAGRLKETKNELEGSSRTTYNPDGTVASTTDELNRTTYYTYDDLKRVTVVTQPGGGQTKNTYDELGNLREVEDSLGNITQYEYDAVGRLIKTIDPDLKETESFYDDAGRLIQTVDARENHTTYTYDEAGRQKSVIDQLEGTTTYEYDEVGRRAAVIDANQNRTTYTYDQQDRVVAVTNASGTVYTEYDAAGQVLSRKDANGNKVEFTYTALGQLKTQKDAAGGTTTFGYDVVGNRISVQDANLHTTTMEYDKLNRLVKTIDPTLREMETVYDAAGQVITTFDASDKDTNYEYNELGLQTKVIDPLEHEIQYTYNTAGQMTSMLDAEGVVTAYEYDALGRLKTVIENYQASVQPTTEINVRTEYTYDENGNRRTIKDGKGNVTTFDYDELNRLISEKDPLENSWTYGYDALGNRISMTDANGNITEYAYDDTNRLEGVNPVGTEADVSFSYDAGGRRIEMTDAIGKTTWEYDDLNRPISITDPFEKTVGYAYDAVGNRIGLTYSGKEVNYEYYDDNRLRVVKDQNNDTNYQYDSLGRLTNILRPNGVNTTYGYDDAGRLVQLQHATAEDELASYQYTYDAVGNRTKAVERLKIQVGPTVHLTVADSSGNLLSGKEVYAFNGETYSGYHQTTNAAGQVAITLPSGDFRFRVDVDGTKFWSGTEDHCTIGQCNNLLVTIPTPVTIVVNDSDGNLRANIPVYAFNGDQYTGYHGATNAEGVLMLRLPEGSYRFRADMNGTQFWSQDTCTVPTCGIIPITVTLPVSVTVLDNVGMPHEGLSVYAFDGTRYTGYHGATDVDGRVTLTLPLGNYRFRADYNGTQFWSNPSGSAGSGENNCTVPECREASIAIMLPLVVTVTGTDGSPQQGISVYAFNGTTYTGFNGKTDVDGRVNLTLPAGNYRFRADLNGTQFWSDPSSSSGQNHCTVPDCTGAQITLTSSTTITVTDTENAPKAGVSVYAFNDTTYTGYHGTTDASGLVSLTLPQGSYRFRADFNGTQFWSGASNHCDVPGCSSASVTVTNGVRVTVQDTNGTPKVGVLMYAFNGTAYTGYNAITNANGEGTFTLPQGSYHFRADYNGTQFWSGASNHCDVPACSSASVTVTNGVQVSVTDTENAPKAGVSVYAFNGTTYTGYHGTTDASGQVSMTLPQGSYRFRADINGTQFWSGASNHCDVPACSSASVTVTNGLLVTVQDTEGAPKAGLKVYAFNGTTYTGFNSTTNANGQVTFTLPQGSYRFRADLNGTQFWSGASNHCSVPGCGSAGITVTNPVAVTVRDTDGDAKPGTKVYAFNGTTYTGYNATTDANGQVALTLPLGNYRFRADLNGTQFWSGASNHCALPGCASADVTITIPLTLTVQTADGTPQSGIKVYAFNGATYTGYSATTSANGQGIFTLQQGNYRFRADYNGTQYWSGASNHCAVPGCLPLTVIVGPQSTATATPTQTETPLPPTTTPVPTETTSPTPEPIATETPVPSETPLARLPENNVFAISYAKPQPLQEDNMGTGVGLVGEYFDNSMDINGEPLYTELAPQVFFEWGDANPENGVPDDFTARWSGQIEAPTSEEYRFGIYADDLVRVLINGQIYIDGWENTEELWREGPAINLVGGQKYDIQIDFRDTAGGATISFNWYTPSGNIEWWTRVPMQYLYPPAANTIVTVSNTDGFPQEGLTVSAFDGTTNTGFNSITNVNGQASFALPDGSYRFRTDMNGTQFWSSETNHCNVPGCHQAEISIPLQYDSVTVDEFDSDTLDSAWTWTAPLTGPTWSLTDNPGFFQFKLPSGSDYGLSDNTAPSLRRDDIGTGNFVIETGLNFGADDPDGMGIWGYDLMIGFSETEKMWLFVDENRLEFCHTTEGCLAYSSPGFAPGFLRIEKAGRKYLFHYKKNAGDNWTYFTSYTTSAAVSYVSMFGIGYSPVSDATYNVDYFSLKRKASTDVTVTVLNTDANPQEGLTVSAFDGAADTGIHGVTDENGQVILTLPEGENYRFRTEYTAPGAGNSIQFWNNSPEVCDVPGCDHAEIVVTASPVTVTVMDTNYGRKEGLTVSAFDGTTDTGIHGVTNENGEVILILPEGNNYRFRTNYTVPGAGNNVQFWNNSPEVCDIPVCIHAEIVVTANPVTVTVMDTDNTRKEGLDVYAFDETTYTGYQLTTDANGQVTFSLPDGNYRFRTDLDGTQFWSAKTNHCNVPDCDQVEIKVTFPILLKVFADYGGPIEGATVYAFDGDQNTGYHQTTDENGYVSFTLPLDGNYRFRADYTAPGAGNSVQFWNSVPEKCTLPACNYGEIVVTRNPAVVTVLDTNSMPKEGLNVYAFDGDHNTGIHLATDANGQVTFTLPYGTYRFRTDLNGTIFWSGAENHCDPNAECEASVITVVNPVIVSVLDTLNTPYPNLPVYAFSVDPSTGSGQAYTGRHGTTDAKGQVTFQLPQGNYHFRADYGGVQFWNNTQNDCAVPGCTSAIISLPGGFANNEVTIDYTYDPLYRLTSANYSTGNSYRYSYDSVGNRLNQQSMVEGLASNISYQYDIANRLTDVGGVTYAYDDNGNLISDGANEYTYDPANRLTAVSSGQSTVASYQYNGLGDRLSQNGVNYTLDLNTGLTQVLSDETNTYTYGLGRISQQSGNTPEYFLGDALGSVRQLTSQSGQVTYAQSYDPYGVVTQSSGSSHTDYGFTGESYGDSTQLVYLRARYYNPADGRFQSRDTWGGISNTPMSFNKWQYVYSNPINITDPTGNEGVPPWVENYLEKLRARTENCYNKGNSLCVWEAYHELALAAPAFGFPHSSDHMLNYLYKGGDIEYETWGGRNVRDSRWVFADTFTRRPLKKVTKEMWRLIHLAVATGSTKGHVNTGNQTTGYAPNGTDLYYALGSFSVSVEADYEVSGCYEVTIKPKYHFYDLYDWHPTAGAGGGVGGLGGFNDSWSASLKPNFAEEYKINGTYRGPNKIYHFSSEWPTWQAGKNIAVSWEYMDAYSKLIDIFHFDD